MYWTRTPYFLLLLGALIILVGGVAAQKRAAYAPADITAWSGAGANLDPYPYDAAPVENPYDTTQTDRGLMHDVTSSAPFSYILPLNADRAGIENTRDAVLDTSGDANPQQTTSTPERTAAPANSSGSFDAYSFIPRGLMNIQTLLSAAPGAAQAGASARDPVQQAIFDYGNAVGSYIQSFESVHRNMTEVLKEFFDDRTNKTKAEGVLSLANDFTELGRQLTKMESVPKEAASLHIAIAQGYATVATGLANLTKTQDDSGLMSAVFAYNASAEEFVKNYVALSRLFGAYGVKFSVSDAGSVFMFNQKVF